MERVLNATEARIHFGDLLRRVSEQRETVVVERGGVPQVVVMALPEYERLMAKGSGRGWRDTVSVVRERVQAELSGRPLPSPEEMLQEARDERDEQFARLR